MNYDELVDALYAQNQFAIKYDLDAMRWACDALGVARPAPVVVLVGGTNGKGTTAALLNALAIAHGVRVGLYTSPHLVEFRERVRIDGRPLSRDDAARIGTTVFHRFSGRDAAPETPRALSYFELTTLLALEAFRAHAVQLAIVEVGLGGRLDATNALERDAVVLASVSLDHQAILGDSLQAIAREKAHLAQPGVPTFLHADSGGYDALVSALRELGVADTVTTLRGGHAPRAWARGLAVETFAHLAPRLGVAPDAGTAESALLRARWPGRQQLVKRAGSRIALDGAHNEAAAAATADWLAQLIEAGELDHRPPCALAVSGDRDPVPLAKHLAPLVSGFVPTDATSAPCVPRDQVAAQLAAAGFNVVATSALDSFIQSPGDKVLTGSLYAVGDALAALGFDADTLPVYT